MNSARLLLCLVFCCTITPPSSARILPHWPDEKMFAEADLVVVVQAVENKDAKDPVPFDPRYHTAANYKAVETRFQVLGVLKNTRAERPKELTVLHFNYSRPQPIANGAGFVHFVTRVVQFERRDMKDGKVIGEVSIQVEYPVWLAFLKRMDDGRFEPVTGHYDSGQSFRTHSHVKDAYPR